MPQQHHKMPDDKLKQWIAEVQKKGYNTEQIKQALIQRGYAPPAAEQIMQTDKLKLSFNKFILSHGMLFTVIFYFFAGIFTLSGLISIIFNIINMQILNVVINTFLLGLVVFYIVKRKFYAAFIMIFFEYFLLVQLIPILQAFIPMSDIVIYILVALSIGFYGLIVSFIFNKVSKTFGKFIGAAVFFSVILSIIAAANSFVVTIFEKLGEQLAQLEGVAQSGILSIFNSNLANPNIVYAISLIFFNLPFFIFFAKRSDKKLMWLLLYLMPILLYIGLSYVLQTIVVNAILTKVNG